MAAAWASDAGESLIETLISVVILGVTATSLVTGLLTAIALSDYRREQAVVEASARSVQQRVAAIGYDDGLRRKLTRDGTACPDAGALSSWVGAQAQGLNLALAVRGTGLEARGGSLKITTTTECDPSRPWVVVATVSTPSAVLGGRLGEVTATSTAVVTP